MQSLSEDSHALDRGQFDPDCNIDNRNSSVANGNMKTISTLRELLSTMVPFMISLQRKSSEAEWRRYEQSGQKMPPATPSAGEVAHGVVPEEQDYDPTALSIENIFEHGPEIEMNALEEAFVREG